MWGMTMMAMSLGESGAAQGQAVDDQTVYELRIYHLNEGKLPLIEERFRTKERALFERHEMHQVAYWTPTDEPLAGGTWVYILRHKSRADADANWAKFKADPDWIALKAETEKDGPFVNKYDITFLKLTDFSPKI
jgi:hypothetical protein